MCVQIPKAVLKCVASIFNLITAHEPGEHSAKIANMDHLCQLVVGEEVWDSAKFKSKLILDLVPGRTTVVERLKIKLRGLSLEQIKQKRGLRAFDELIKIGIAFDPTLNLWYDLAADKDQSDLSEDYLNLLRLPEWSGINRLRHKRVPLAPLEDLTYAYALYDLAGPIAIAEQASVVMIAHLIWCEDCWNEEMRATMEELPRPKLYDHEAEEEKNLNGDYEDGMSLARDRMRSAKKHLLEIDRGLAEALHWIESDVEWH